MAENRKNNDDQEMKTNLNVEDRAEAIIQPTKKRSKTPVAEIANNQEVKQESQPKTKGISKKNAGKAHKAAASKAAN